MLYLPSPSFIKCELYLLFAAVLWINTFCWLPAFNFGPSSLLSILQVLGVLLYSYLQSQQVKKHGMITIDISQIKKQMKKKFGLWGRVSESLYVNYIWWSFVFFYFILQFHPASVMSYADHRNMVSAVKVFFTFIFHNYQKRGINGRDFVWWWGFTLSIL